MRLAGGETSGYRSPLPVLEGRQTKASVRRPSTADSHRLRFRWFLRRLISDVTPGRKSKNFYLKSISSTLDLHSHLIQINKIRATPVAPLSALFSCSLRSRKRKVCRRDVRLWDSDFPEAELKAWAVRRLRKEKGAENSGQKNGEWGVGNVDSIFSPLPIPHSPLPIFLLMARSAGALAAHTRGGVIFSLASADRHSG